MDVKTERTHWRDEKLSCLHRVWGWDCPVVDIDWLVLEYDKSIPVALVEYKNENASPQSPSHPSYKALSTLGDLASIPFFAVRYASDFTWWRIIPLNTYAKLRLPERKEMDHIEYVSFLYDLRGRAIPEDVIKRIENLDLDLF